MDKKSEVSMSEYRKLALRYKTLEAQIRQTVPKKEHHDAVAKLEKQVDSLEKELDRTKADLQKFNSFGKQLGAISDTITTQGKATGSLNRAIESISFKMSQGAVPASVHSQTLGRVRELEEQCRAMVSKAEYESLGRRYEDVRRQADSMVSAGEYGMLKQRGEELSRQLNLMVPGSEYATLKQRCEDLESTFSSMVPRAQLESSEARGKELEARLAEHVPQAVYDELVSKVVSLAEEVTGGSRNAESESTAQSETTEETSALETGIEPFGDINEPSSPEFSEPEPQFEATADGDSAQPTSEITEVQAQLAEISATQNEATEETPGTEPEAQVPAPLFPTPQRSASSASETV